MRTVSHFKLAIITIIYITQHSCRAKIMRNNALMTRMMSHFQKDKALAGEQETESPSEDPHQRPQHQQIQHRKEQPQVLTLMQNVLCKNFPSIPCKLITTDATLRKLMERSVQQITLKKLSLDRTTVPPGYDLTLFPMINSEDLSNFVQESHTGYFNKKRAKQKNSRKKNQGTQRALENFWSHERIPSKKVKGIKEVRQPELYTGRKKIRKFYPHKVKYKDDKTKGTKSEFRNYSDEKLSMSVEVPEMITNRKPNSQRMTYKVDGNDPPVWRIDYMKHGEPSLNMFAYEDDRLRGKIMQTGPNVIVDENVLEQAARKDVLHPDVYIKKKFIRKGAVNVNSEGTD